MAIVCPVFFFLYLDDGSSEVTASTAIELESGSHKQPLADAPSPTNSTVGDLTMMEEGQDDD